MFTIFTPFFTLGPASTTLYSTHALSHGLISSTTFLQHSTTLYSLQLYSSSTVYNLYSTPLVPCPRCEAAMCELCNGAVSEAMCRD